MYAAKVEALIQEKSKQSEPETVLTSKAPAEVADSSARDQSGVSQLTEERTKRIIISKPHFTSSQYRPVSSPSTISVGSLHQLKRLLEQSEERRQRVIRGVGEQAYKEFLNLVSSLQDQSLLIEDFNIRTLYFTILNFSEYPLSPEMKSLEPLSNFSLRLQPFVDLKNLFVKDVNIKKIVSEKLGAAELENFEGHVKTLTVTVRDFIQKDQEKNILLYHKVGESLVMMSYK